WGAISDTGRRYRPRRSRSIPAAEFLPVAASSGPVALVRSAHRPVVHGIPLLDHPQELGRLMDVPLERLLVGAGSKLQLGCAQPLCLLHILCEPEDVLFRRVPPVSLPQPIHIRTNPPPVRPRRSKPAPRSE